MKQCSYSMALAFGITFSFLGSTPPARAQEHLENASIPAHVSMADAVRLFRERGFDLIVADATVDSVRGDA
jgi:hypothetical protein